KSARSGTARSDAMGGFLPTPTRDAQRAPNPRVVESGGRGRESSEEARVLRANSSLIPILQAIHEGEDFGDRDVQVCGDDAADADAFGEGACEGHVLDDRD